MDEQEREKIIKESRIAALNDLNRALARLIDERGPHDSVSETAKILSYYLGQMTSEVSQDKIGRIRL